MKVCITLEHRFLGTPDGRTWTITQFPYEFFKNYLDVFDRVRVIARVSVEKVEPKFRPVDGPELEVFAMPPYKGPFEFARQCAKVQRRAETAVDPGDAVILRVHSQVANSVEAWLTRRKQPFALEVVADPIDVLSFRANKHPVAPIARLYFADRLRSQCRRAIAVSYVTREALQRRYPPDEKHYSTNFSSVSLRPESFADYHRRGHQFATSFSDVELSNESFSIGQRRGRAEKRRMRAVFVGTLDSLYKGPDTLVEAVALCRQKGVELELVFIGSGRYLEILQRKCERLGIRDQVRFTGALPAGEPVRQELDAADVFVLPCRAEGLPRAMVEAMARGLPCIGSTVGGIPELLEPEEMTPPNNPKLLADKLISVTSDPARLSNMSERGLRIARDYSASVLTEKRREFYQTVKAITALHYGLRPAAIAC